MTSTLESTFDYLLRVLAPDLPEPETEYRIIPSRKWRWDCAWPVEQVAIELQGGLWTYGAHTRPAGVQRDMEKHNAATCAGWRLLYFSTDMLTHEPEKAIAQVRALLAREVN
jgi:very-short-patch-repair endonuclease